MSRMSLLIVFVFIVAGCATAKPYVELRPASFEPSSTAVRVVTPLAIEPQVFVFTKPLLTDGDFIAASLSEDNMGNRVVSLILSDAAGERLFRYTRENIGKPLAIFVDGELISAPVVQSALKNKFIITGGRKGLTDTQAEQIVSAVSRN